jgi:hypothetical protein
MTPTGAVNHEKERVHIVIHFIFLYSAVSCHHVLNIQWVLDDSQPESF